MKVWYRVTQISPDKPTRGVAASRLHKVLALPALEVVLLLRLRWVISRSPRGVLMMTTVKKLGGGN
jgi:hypothetical protein